MALPTTNDLHVLQHRLNEVERELHRLRHNVTHGINNRGVTSGTIHHMKLDAEGLRRAASALCWTLEKFA